MCNCEECKHLCFYEGVKRGSMDCDPDEWYCDLDLECPDDETECTSYSKFEEYTYDDYLEDHWDERNDR